MQHLELVMKLRNGVEVVQRDDIERPKLKMRKHDFHWGGFDVIADRHGEDSVEVMAVAAIGTKAMRQGWLPGF